MSLQYFPFYSDTKLPITLCFNEVQSDVVPDTSSEHLAWENINNTTEEQIDVVTDTSDEHDRENISTGHKIPTHIPPT